MTINSEAVVINAGSKLWIPILLVKPNSILSWTFTIKDYNCGFGIANSEKDIEEEYIVPKDYYDADEEVTGSVVIENPGTVYLCWDNSYSWIRSKTIVYSFSIEQPNDLIEEKHISSAYLIL